MMVGGKQQGVTLVEIALALLLIGLLTTGALTFNGVFRQLTKAEETKEQLSQIKMGLMSYLKVNHYLPCPDTNSDGLEDRRISLGVSVCQSRQGTLPYQTLSVTDKDAWGSPFYYRVNPRTEQNQRINDLCETASIFGYSGARVKPDSSALCEKNGVFYCDKCGDVCGGACDYNTDVRQNDAPPYFSLHTPPKGAENADGYKNMRVLNEQGAEFENAIVVMVVSFGSNGTQTWLDCEQATTAASPERANCDNDSAGVFQIDTSDYLDDYLTWITLHDVKQAMIDVRGF